MSPLDSSSLNSEMDRVNPNIPDSIITGNASDFHKNFDASSFMFSHNLAGHPLFSLDRLAKLADHHIKNNVGLVFNNNDADVSGSWNSFSKASQSKTVMDGIKSIEDSKSWILLYRVQTDPEYAQLLNQIVDELQMLSDRELHQEITWLDAYIFIASPQALTPYHLDHESTFLFQITGERDANLFNGNDLFILSEEEIEEYFIGNLQAAKYSNAKQKKANVYKLVDGKGVHHPPRFPHWYQNGDRYSIALGVHFCQKSFDQQAKVYQINYYLRKLLKKRPTPPGQSAWKDHLKVLTIDIFSDSKPSTKMQALHSGLQRIRRILSPFIK